MKRILLCELTIALALSLTACRSTGPTETTSGGQTSRTKPVQRTSLRDRAEKYWQARVDKDWKTVYNFLEPWQRASGTPDNYEEWAKENEPFNVLSYEIIRAEEEGPYGWVRVKYESTLRVYPDSPPRQTEVDQKWQAESGDWIPVSGTNAEGYPIPPWLRDKQAEAKLRQRFEQAWKARQARDWNALYQLVDPEDRDDVSESEYAESEALFDYLGCDVKWVEAVADQGKVRVSYLHKVNDPNLTKLPERQAELTEHWVKVNNEWYRDLKRRGA